jgi:hypothetical protein
MRYVATTGTLVVEGFTCSWRSLRIANPSDRILRSEFGA